MKSNTMRCVVYIMCHDDASQAIAEEMKVRLATPRVETHVLLLGKSMFFENQAFCMLSEKFDEWKDADFVGTISYSSEKKSRVTFDIDAILDDVSHEYDVISMLNYQMWHRFRRLDMYESLMGFHGKNVIQAWKTLLDAVGCDEKEIFRDVVSEFYCNSFLARPLVFKQFIEFNMMCQKIVLENEHVREVMMKDVVYPNGNLTPHELKEIYGVEQWPSIPFVFERLAPWYMSGKHRVLFATPTVYFHFA